MYDTNSILHMDPTFSKSYQAEHVGKFSLMNVCHVVYMNHLYNVCDKHSQVKQAISALMARLNKNFCLKL